jgi:hypothetical protein
VLIKILYNWLESTKENSSRSRSQELRHIYVFLDVVSWVDAVHHGRSCFLAVCPAPGSGENVHFFSKIIGADVGIHF